MTYPPEPVNGYLVAGMLTPGTASFAYPAELGRELVTLPGGYQIDVEAPEADRAEFLTPERFPQADRLIHVNYDRETGQLEPMGLPLTPASYVVVATWGWDEPALAQVLSADPQPAYVSLISSKTKWRVIRTMLAERGVAAARLDRVHAPAGLDLGAETPGEIAIALIAQMLAVRRKAGVMAT